jgi:hypothetical protein
MPAARRGAQAELAGVEGNLVVLLFLIKPRGRVVIYAGCEGEE